MYGSRCGGGLGRGGYGSGSGDDGGDSSSGIFAFESQETQAGLNLAMQLTKAGFELLIPVTSSPILIL